MPAIPKSRPIHYCWSSHKKMLRDYEASVKANRPPPAPSGCEPAILVV